MPLDNWDKVRKDLERKNTSLEVEWQEGSIIGVGKDVDGFVRDQLKKEYDEQHPKDAEGERRR